MPAPGRLSVSLTLSRRPQRAARGKLGHPMMTGDSAMAQQQNATPPPWLGRSRGALLLDIVGGRRQARGILVHLFSFFATLLRPSRVRPRLEPLRGLAHLG